MAVTTKRGVLTLALSILLSISVVDACAQAKWWWEKYPSSSDKTLGLKNSVGSSVDTKVNSTGGNASVSGNAATQPPTVIIQQTASSTAVSTPTMTCFQPASLGVTSGSYYYGATLTACPSVQGFNVTTMMGGNSPGNFYYNGTGYVGNVILGCCYVPIAAATPSAGGVSFSPWANFGDGGYSGTQHTAFTAPGSHTFTIPPGVFRVWATVVGGGGGGAGNSYNSWGGGSGGVLYRYPIDVMPNDTMQVVVGSGGGGGNVGNPGAGFQAGASGGYGYSANSAAGGGGSSAVRYNTLVAGAGGGSGSVAPSWWDGSTGYGTGGGLAGPGSSTSVYGGSGYGGTFSIKAGSSSGNATGGNTNGAGGYNGSVGAYAGSPCGGGGGYGYTNGAGGGVGVASGGGCVNFAAAGQGGNAGGTHGPTGYGASGTYSTGAGKPFGSVYPGGGGAAGFIGMSWSTGVPSAESGKCSAGYGSGGFGYGAGGGGSVTGHAGCTSVATAAGGKGADGAVFIEW